MAHNISEVTIDGQVFEEAVFAGTPAWHGLGTVLDNAPDSETAIRTAHLDWTVEKQPLTLPNGTIMPNAFGLVRTDIPAGLSVVGNDYEPLQNADAFAFLDSLLQDGIMKYESAFSLKGGQGVVLLARMPSIDYVTPKDAMKRYLLLSNWHGGGALTVKPTSVRVVCNNTLDIAMRQGKNYSIRHSGNMASKLATMQRYLAQFDKAFTDYREAAQSLLKGYSPEQAAQFIAELFPAPAADATKRALTNHENQIAELKKFFKSPANQMDGVKGTFWALFNTVTETVDHGGRARQSTDPLARAENRFLSITDGDRAKLKERAFELALTMAA